MLVGVEGADEPAELDALMLLVFNGGMGAGRKAWKSRVGGMAVWGWGKVSVLNFKDDVVAPAGGLRV